MRNGFDLFWMLRLRCRAVAACDRVRENETHIRLCRRWRWHTGECR